MLSAPTRSTLISGLLHAGAIVLVLIVTRYRPIPVPEKAPPFMPLADISKYVPRAPSKGGRGGGGGGDQTRASRGPLPRVALRQFTPPAAVVRNYNPQLAMEPTLVGSPRVAEMPNLAIGDPNGVAGPPSGGRGKCCGIGDGKGDGIGDLGGPGYGKDNVDGVSGSTHIVGTATNPELLVKTDPEYTDEARRAKLQGVVVLHIEVDTKGQPRNISVTRSLGLGLDDRAVQAVRQWKFRAGTINGKPVVTSAEVYVTFRLL